MWRSENTILHVCEWNTAEDAAAPSVLADPKVDLDNSAASKRPALLLPSAFVVLCWRL